MTKVLGIDVGGTGIKGALVDTRKGELVTERKRYPTEGKIKPVEVMDLIADLWMICSGRVSLASDSRPLSKMEWL